MTTCPIVVEETFIVAARDAGYKSTVAAVAELIDNSVQASADVIDVLVRSEHSLRGSPLTLAVLDDGCGMTRQGLRAALQFGGSSRFGDRNGLGRFGFGLPNSSISQTRRVEVFTWRRANRPLHSYIDVDEIASGRAAGLPEPRHARLPAWVGNPATPSGTLIQWKACDRLTHRTVNGLTKALREGIGRIYRHILWGGVTIRINGVDVEPIDPLFERNLAVTPAASAYGEDLRIEFKVPMAPSRSSFVTVRFTTLPVKAWRHFSSEEKRKRGITGGGGVSIVRADREVDYGWFFMGSKRRENYDDWWRCEVRFNPELDEYFRVTNSKQGISPHAVMNELLSSHLEPVARRLNSCVRQEFDSGGRSSASAERVRPQATEVATRAEKFLPVPPSGGARSQRFARACRGYTIQSRRHRGGAFYDVRKCRGMTRVVLNTNHPFYHAIYSDLSKASPEARFALESLLLAAARAEACASDAPGRDVVRRFREAWSDALFTYLTRR
jgi:hypothetical protein